jgi:hypothetical protein
MKFEQGDLGGVTAMADNKITVLVFPVGKPGEVQQIERTLDAMQALVGGGFIEMVPYAVGTALVCNEEGKLNGMPPNRPAWGGQDVICGQFFFVGPADDEGNSTSLNDAQILKLKEEFDAKSE